MSHLQYPDGDKSSPVQFGDEWYGESHEGSESVGRAQDDFGPEPLSQRPSKDLHDNVAIEERTQNGALSKILVIIIMYEQRQKDQ